MSMTTLDQINENIGGEVTDAHEVGRFKVWFRPFVPSMHNDLLVAAWLATPTDGEGPYLVSVVGSGYCDEYMKGGSWPIDDCVITGRWAMSFRDPKQLKRKLSEYIDSARERLVRRIATYGEMEAI